MPDPDVLPQFKIAFQPAADPLAVVSLPNVRFTILTTRLLRLEFSPSGQFEDHPSQVFWYRQQPVPAFEVLRSGEGIEITTRHLRLSYNPTLAGANGFSRKALSIEVFATGHTWRFGDRDHTNLGGTTRTLDGADGEVRLEPGLLSRQGWALVDDSASLVFNEDCWLEQRAHTQNLDLYFFGHGHDYLGALEEFTRTAGPIPLLPRWALGSWWSRFWPYTQAEYLGVMQEFADHNRPLSVGVIDMDWHLTQTGNASTGWTGFTWNRQLFPHPDAFLAELHARGLKTALNIHPAEGVHPHEEQYPEMARRLGIDPQSKDPVPFDIASPRFTRAYFEVLLHPMEQMGVDFWWMDWQQGDRSTLLGLDPLYWLNHLHFLDLGRDAAKRPFIFSRWPGLGGHRYPIGFSGDTFISWATLAFQPQFTATASNVAYTWWSHDIGGHMRGVRDPELYARWVQYGVFSPILRLHSTSNRFIEHRPWGHDAEIERAACRALALRDALVPYLYSMAWRAAETTRPLIQPMYYLYPEAEDAYRCSSQYFYGSELVAAPFVTPRDPATRLASQTVWLPEGDWFNFFSGEHLPGGRWATLYGGLDEIPLLARAGAIVPLAGAGSPAGANPAALSLHIFPGADNSFELNEDDGQTQAYRQGHFCLTRFSQKWGGTQLDFQVEPAQGDASLLPPRRTYSLRFYGLRQPDRIRLLVNGVETGFRKEDQDGALLLADILLSPADRLEVQLKMLEGSLLSHRDHRAAAVRKMLTTFNLGADACWEIYNALPDLLSGKTSLRRFANQLQPAHLEALETVLKEK